MPLNRRGLIAVAASLAVPLRASAQPAAPIRIGVLTDLSGQYRDNSGPTSVLAAHQAVEDFQRERHGVTVEILAADHQQKPDIGVAIARQWFDRDGVNAIADLNNTAIALAVRTQAVEGPRPAGQRRRVRGPDRQVLRSQHGPLGAGHLGRRALDRRGVAARRAQDVLLVAADYNFGQTLEREVAALVQAGGGAVLGTVRYPFPGTTDFSAYLV